MAKYTGRLKKGDIVFKYRRRHSRRDQNEPDYRVKYKIRSIGAKRAIIDQVNDGQGYYSPRGRAEDLVSKQRSDENWANYNSFYPYDWSQIFIPAGEEGWDPSFNV